MTGEWIANAVGTAAALCSITSFIPQIIKIVTERDASSVALKTYVLTVTCFVLWVIYGVMIGAWPITISNAFALVACSIVLFLKWRYRDGKPVTRQTSATPCHG